MLPRAEANTPHFSSRSNSFFKAAMINKLLHAPISQLKRNSGDEDEDRSLYVAALKKLFDLEEK